MSIEVNGNNNRVAGRDYYEVPIKPCPRCEQRVIAPKKKICNHCESQEANEAAKFRLLAGAFITFLLSPWITEWCARLGFSTNIVEGLLVSGFLVVNAYVIFQVLITQR